MKVELSIHAAGLKNVAGLGKGTSDPFAVVTALPAVAGQPPKVLGKTEVIKNSLSPQWVKVFLIDYELGTPCKVAVNIFDEVRKSDNKPMGSTIFEIGELLGARGSTKAKLLKKKGGTVFASVRKARGSGTLRLQLRGDKLKNVEGGIFGKSDPFWEASKKVNHAGALTWDNVYRSAVIKNNLNPTWEPATIELSTLCDGDLDAPVLITLYDHESKGKHTAMGKVEVSVNSLIRAVSSQQSFTLKEKGRDVGSVKVIKAEVHGVTTGNNDADIASRMATAATITPSAPPAPQRAPALAGASFVDYMAGGCELNVVVGIDFTGSNGDPRKPGTLHYKHPDGRTLNDYEKAIQAILRILSDYDSDQMFPVYGLGAKYGGQVRHCFQCGASQEVHGVDGVLQAYKQVFKSGLIMSGPTVFTEVAQVAAAKAISEMEAAQAKGSLAYSILLIVTDGAVSDVNATAAVLDQLSVNAPLSVVIVGVGNADFSAMQFLDDANAGHTTKRDIAQFVPFNKFSHNSTDLTSHTLQEIPDQLVSYFQSKGIAPLPAIQRTDSEIIVTAEQPSEEDEIDLTLDIGEDEIVVTGCGTNHIVDDFASGFGK